MQFFNLNAGIFFQLFIQLLLNKNIEKNQFRREYKRFKFIRFELEYKTGNVKFASTKYIKYLYG